MKKNPTSQISHPLSEENLYIPPQIDNDALKAHQNAGMVSPSVLQDKTKSSQSQGDHPGEYVPIFPKKEGEENDHKYYQTSYPYTDYSCNDCGKCDDCRIKREKEWKNQNDYCMGFLKCAMCCVFGVCIMMAGGDTSGCYNVDCFGKGKQDKEQRN